MKKSTINVKNIEDLREHALQTLHNLEVGNIDCTEAGVAGKLYEAVISSLKTELAYAHMQGTAPRIKFLEGRNTVDAVKLKTITHKKQG